MPHFSIFKNYNIELEPAEEAIFRRFLELFMEYNSHTNLSAIRTPGAIIEKHFIDSLELGRFVELSGKVLDIGSGGGFPGIPLKILFPDADFTLMDSVGKKVRAMNHFIEWLGLTGIRAVQARAEEIVKSSKTSQKWSNLNANWEPEWAVRLYGEWGNGDLNSKNEFFRGFDFVISRATAYLPQILEWAEPFLASGGQIILYKLASPDELEDGAKMMRKLKLRLVAKEPYTIAWQERVFLIFERI